MSSEGLEAVRERRDELAALATSELRTASAARRLLEAAGANYKCSHCGGYLKSTDKRCVFECIDCGATIREEQQ